MAEPFLHFVHPDDIEATKAASATLAGPGNVSVVDFENRYRCRDGAYRWLRWVVSSADDGLYFVAKDVSEQRASNAQCIESAGLTEAIVESIADGLYVTDPERRLSFINPAALALLGYESAEELLGRSPAQFYSPQSVSTFEATVNGGGSAGGGEADFRRADGSVLPVSFSSAAIPLGEGSGSVVAFRDISEQRERDLQVQQELTTMSWVGRIREALDDDRFVLYAQPIVDVVTREVVEHELLVRMSGPDGNLIAPGEFLPAAEQYDLMQEIDRRVITLAMRYAARGHPIAINLSADSISERGLFGFIEELVSSHGVDASLLMFEITETAIINNEPAAQAFVRNARRLNCGVALDDFGTGYGSFHYLKQLPATHLKIDQEFVRDLDTDPGAANRHIIQAIVALARGMGMRTVAEGVETEGAFGLLEGLGVDLAQGYLLARPAPAEDILLDNQRTES